MPVGERGACRRKTPKARFCVDAELSPQVSPDWFVPDYWREQDALRMQSGGRGGVAVIDTPVGECVLRHYRRGGMVAA